MACRLVPDESCSPSRHSSLPVVNDYNEDDCQPFGMYRLLDPFQRFRWARVDSFQGKLYNS